MMKTSDKYQSSEHKGLYHEFSGDNRDQRSFTLWSTFWLSFCRRAARQGAIAAVFTDWRQLPCTTDALQAAGWVWRGIGVWDKTEAARPQKGRYRAQAEYFAWGSSGPMDNMEKPCAPGVFRYSVFGDDKLHIAGKPVKLMRDILQICGETVADPFMGSGSTGVAAAQLGIRFVGIEIDEPHFMEARRRIERALEEKANELPLDNPENAEQLEFLKG